MWLISRLCCIMLDIVDHCVFRGLFLIVRQQQCLQITRWSAILICLLLSLHVSDRASERLVVWLPERSPPPLFFFSINLDTPVRTHICCSCCFKLHLKPKNWIWSFQFFKDKGVQFLNHTKLDFTQSQSSTNNNKIWHKGKKKLVPSLKSAETVSVLL